MKKIMKFLHSRYFLAAFCIALEFVQVLAVFVFLAKAFFPIMVLGAVFDFGVLLYLINKDENPEFKLPWMMLLLILPVIGAFVFILLSSTESSKEEKRKFIVEERIMAAYQNPEESLAAMPAEDARAWGQAKYICHSTHLPCHSNTKATYYRIGEEFHEALLKNLKMAERYILMEYFIVEEGVFWDSILEILREKARQGVEVYLMYDDFGCMATLPGKYYRQMEAEGIHCIPSNKFTPVLSNIHNNRDHRKITVIDGTVGFTGGVNLADEYINAVVKFGHWKDTAIRLEGEGVTNLIYLFLQFWNIQSKQTLEYRDFLVKGQIVEAGGVVIPYGDGPELLYPESIGKNVYLNMINTAQEYVYITTPYLICDYEMLSALCLAAAKGVDVRIITPHIPDKQAILLMTQSNYKKLIRAGVKIYEYTPGFIHAKNFVCDDLFAVCGTINLDYRSLVHHFECGVWMYDTPCIADMKQDYLDTQEKSMMISEEEARLKGWKRLIAEIMKVFSPLL